MFIQRADSNLFAAASKLLVAEVGKSARSSTNRPIRPVVGTLLSLACASCIGWLENPQVKRDPIPEALRAAIGQEIRITEQGELLNVVVQSPRRIGEMWVFDERYGSLGKPVPEKLEKGQRIVQHFRVKTALLVQGCDGRLSVPAWWVPKEKWREIDDPEYAEMLVCGFADVPDAEFGFQCPKLTDGERLIVVVNVPAEKSGWRVLDAIPAKKKGYREVVIPDTLKLASLESDPRASMIRPLLESAAQYPAFGERKTP